MTLSLGLDLSLTGTGLVILNEKKEVVEQKLIKSKKTGDTPKEELERLIGIREEIQTIVDDVSNNFKRSRPKMAAIEGPAFMVRNATALVQLGALSYMIRELLYARSIPFVIVAPTTLKKFITGKGSSDKNVVLMEIFKRYGQTFTDDNLGDAYALARVADTILG